MTVASLPLPQAGVQARLRVLRREGFTDLRRLNKAIAPYDDDLISRIVHGGRQGQLTRMECVLLAAMGQEYIRRHPWARSDAPWWADILDSWLIRIRGAGIPVGTYIPGAPDILGS